MENYSTINLGDVLPVHRVASNSHRLAYGERLGRLYTSVTLDLDKRLFTGVTREGRPEVIGNRTLPHHLSTAFVGLAMGVALSVPRFTVVVNGEVRPVRTIESKMELWQIRDAVDYRR
ncbi:MAG: hypothetical protein ACPGLY_28060 [Rubripirellula sp.]